MGVCVHVGRRARQIWRQGPQRGDEIGLYCLSRQRGKYVHGESPLVVIAAVVGKKVVGRVVLVAVVTAVVVMAVVVVVMAVVTVMVAVVTVVV